MTRVALVKATKQKANSATDEIRVENQGRNYVLQSKDSHYLQKNKRQLKFMSSHH